MSRFVLALALAASLLVPVGGATLLAALPAGTPTGTEWDKDELIDIHNELVGLDATARAGSANHAVEARRVAREARAWMARYEADAPWEEFAAATAAMAETLARVLEDPASVTDAEWSAATARLAAAEIGLPPERQPTDP